MSKRIIKKDYWFKHIENWQKSGLKQKEYCEQEKLSLYSFTSWRTIFLSAIKIKEPKQETVTFLPAKVKPKHSDNLMGSPTVISVLLPNKIQLQLPANLAQHELLNFLKVLGELS